MAEADTIFAVATGAQRAAIAVLRISGPGSGEVLDRMAPPRPWPRRASLRALRSPDGEVLDRALVLFLPGPASYTGEDGAELHLHGGPAVVDGVCDALVAAGLRPAEPGEFTRRAFLNGRMDLTEAEAVHDLVAAETSAQRRQALRQLDGELGTLYRDWAARLRLLLARQEALIDFPDEALPESLEAEGLAGLAALSAEIAAHLVESRGAERLRDGLVFAITGKPNVGKSSLLNALARRSVAIVSPRAGTTRDLVETRLVFAGVPVTIVDTAGLRETADVVEAEGVRRAIARAREADLVIQVLDPADHGTAGPREDGDEASGLLVVNKIDLDPDVIIPDGAIPISVLTGTGLDTLRARLDAAAADLTRAQGPLPPTRARHRAALEAARANLAAAATADLPELRAEDLRQALRAIGRITGAVGVEDLLDSIFGEFCIGK